MKTYISLLRGINVSGHNMIKMDVLKKCYESMRFQNIQTYLQSGNIVFRCPESKPQDLEQKISEQLRKQFALEVPVIVLDAEELKAVVGNNPYIQDPAKESSFLHVTFLSSIPETVDPEEIRQKQLPGEDCFVTEKIVYLYCPKGYGNTKLTNTFFEKKLHVRATTRNWKTTCELLKIAESNQ